jgi:arginine decarboxylase
MSLENTAIGRRDRTVEDFFFSAVEGRQDAWQRLHALGHAWVAAQAAGEPVEVLVKQARSLLAELEPLETYFAYPGALAEQLSHELATENAAGFARLSRLIARSLLGASYRFGGGHDRPDKPGVDPSLMRVPDFTSDGRNGSLYFELLIVGVAEPEAQKRVRRELRRFRRHDDPFHYEPVFVPTFEDAALATICNFDLQAVVIYDGFPFASSLGLANLGQYLCRRLDLKPDAIEPTSHGVELAKWIYGCRPQLDVYLLTDKAPETLACKLNTEIVRRVFYDVEEFMELHLAILEGVGQRYATPYFDNLKKYARTPVGTFHALPVARGKSVFKSHWIRDMGEFYGHNLFLAESSATTGGLDSLLEPTGNIRIAQEKAARAFGADRCYFVTNGTSTSNKVVSQALCRPGDVCLADRNCHKSHHYGFVLSGAEVIYLEAFPLSQYSMYGAVPISTITKALLDLKDAGKLHRVRMITLTNCTFDGHMYNVKRVMRECLAIKPDLIFLWDEAWFGFARFDPMHRRRSAMQAARDLRQELGGKARIRVYETNSTHKSMSALRQASMILVADDDFSEVAEPFEEAFMTHTSTSPNLQIIATLDLARRQMELEGYELTMKMTALALQIRRQINEHPLISKYFRALTPGEMIPAQFRESGVAEYPPTEPWTRLLDAWDADEVALDPTRITITCGPAGFDGTQFKNYLAERFDIQLNKTSRNSVLIQANINNTRSDAAHLIQVLAQIAGEIDRRHATATPEQRREFQRRVDALTRDVPELPDFSRFHDAFRPDPQGPTPEGAMRDAFYMAYRIDACEHIKLDSEEIDRRLEKGPELVSANFVIPYPPGFPIMVPGQVISREIVSFMRKLDVHEIHGYHAAMGLKLLKPEALAARQKAASRRRDQPVDRQQVGPWAGDLNVDLQSAKDLPAGLGSTKTDR